MPRKPIRKANRPEKPIDWELVDKLLLAGCPGTEIAPHFDMHPETLYRRIEQQYHMGYTEYCSLKRSKGESLLRQVQFSKAVKGDNTLLVWLGKNRLKQSDSPVETALAEKTLENYDALMNQLSSLRSQRNISDTSISAETKS